MRKLIYASSLVLLTTLLLNSCKKQETAPSGAFAPLTTNNPSNQRGDDCFYIPFTQTGANTWTVNQAGVTMTFTDLHIKSDGRLYGKLASVSPGSGALIITGGDSYNNREYAVEITTCTGNFNITKTTTIIPYTQYISLYGNTSFFTLNGQGATPPFLFLPSISGMSGIPLYSVSSGVATITSYHMGSMASCTMSALLNGKLYAKGVQSHAGPNNTVTFTYTELGIASMCTPDELVGLEMN